MFRFGCWLLAFSEKTISGSQVVSHFLFLCCVLFFHGQHVLDLRELAGAWFIQPGCPWWQIMHQGGQRAWKFYYVREAGKTPRLCWGQQRVCTRADGWELGSDHVVLQFYGAEVGCERPGAGLMRGAPCCQWDPSALAAGGTASDDEKADRCPSLLEVARAAGEDQLWLEEMRSNLSSPEEPVSDLQMASWWALPLAP